jgi:hypothetical protein
MSSPTTTSPDTPVVRRRAKGRREDNRRVNFLAPKDIADTAVAACHDRGESLATQLVRALERIAAGETL